MISSGEPEFNDSSGGRRLTGYVKADKDFSKIRHASLYSYRGLGSAEEAGTVYAVKFGTAQKISYVCDQAIAVLEIIRNNANVKKLDPDRGV